MNIGSPDQVRSDRIRRCQAPESLEILKQVQDDVGGRMTGGGVWITGLSPVMT